MSLDRKTKDLILEVMPEGKRMEMEEIVKKVKEKDDSKRENTISREVRKLYKVGKIKRTKRGTYRKNIEKSKTKSLEDY